MKRMCAAKYLPIGIRKSVTLPLPEIDRNKGDSRITT